MNRVQIQSAVVALAITSCSCLTSAEVFRVKEGAPDNGDGDSWTTPFKYLQDAIVAAEEEDDEIRVAQGTYYPDDGEGSPPTGRTAAFDLPPDVRIYGGFDGTETLFSERASRNRK